MKKLFVATPMFGGMGHCEYMTSLMNLYGQCASKNIPFTFATVSNESLIPRARNLLVSMFLQTDFTHLLFIDSDIEFDPNDVVKMLDHDKDILCGIYPKKEINWERVSQAARSGAPTDKLQYNTATPVIQVLKDKDYSNVDFTKPVEIKYGPTGMMLVKRSVFETLSDKVPSHKHQNPNEPNLSVFFDTSIKGDEYLSEDYHFCDIWRETGGKIYAAPWVKMNHVGRYKYSGF